MLLRKIPRAPTMAIETGPRQRFLCPGLLKTVAPRCCARAVLPCVMMLAQAHESG